jgi:IMP dehydrogenase/GMP reductase
MELKNTSMKFDFKDITIVPEKLSFIESRKEVNTRNENGVLPIMVSPMDTVIDSKNCDKFIKNNLCVCLPRGVNHHSPNIFHSISLEDFENMVNWYSDEFVYDEPTYILVDIANGHMSKLHRLCSEFITNKKLNNHKLMVGNVANPETFKLLCEIGVEYVRIGIGGGSACLTSANTGVHYPMGSLISECYKIKKENGYTTKIVADGGFRNYDDIIKALALGSDFVMLGSVLNKTLESCSETKLFNLIPLSYNQSLYIWDNIPSLRKCLYKSFRGMSTKEVQKKWGREKLKTSEGITKTNKVEYKLSSWVENFEDYLKSAMSYTNSKTLEEFKESETIFITENALKRYNK